MYSLEEEMKMNVMRGEGPICLIIMPSVINWLILLIILIARVSHLDILRYKILCKIN